MSTTPQTPSKSPEVVQACLLSAAKLVGGHLPACFALNFLRGCFLAAMSMVQVGTAAIRMDQPDRKKLNEGFNHVFNSVKNGTISADYMLNLNGIRYISGAIGGYDIKLRSLTALSEYVAKPTQSNRNRVEQADSDDDIVDRTNSDTQNQFDVGSNSNDNGDCGRGG